MYANKVENSDKNNEIHITNINIHDTMDKQTSGFALNNCNKIYIENVTANNCSQ